MCLSSVIYKQMFKPFKRALLSLAHKVRHPFLHRTPILVANDIQLLNLILIHIFSAQTDRLSTIYLILNNPNLHPRDRRARFSSSVLIKYLFLSGMRLGKTPRTYPKKAMCLKKIEPRVQNTISIIRHNIQYN